MLHFTVRSIDEIDIPKGSHPQTGAEPILPSTQKDTLLFSDSPARETKTARVVVIVGVVVTFLIIIADPRLALT